MSVWKCPRCKSVAIIVNPQIYAVEGADIEDIEDTCPNVGCRALMERLDEPDAGNAVYAAFYAFDHGFSRLSLAEQVAGLKEFNASLQGFLATLEAQP